MPIASSSPSSPANCTEATKLMEYLKYFLVPCMTMGSRSRGLWNTQNMSIAEVYYPPTSYHYSPIPKVHVSIIIAYTNHP